MESNTFYGDFMVKLIGRSSRLDLIYVMFSP